jgi:hypothetical protein
MNIMGEDDKPMGLCHCGSKFATTWAQWHFAARAFCFFGLEKCQQNWPWRIALLCDFPYDSSVFSSGP